MGKRCGNCANSTWLGGMDAVPEICLKCKYVHGEPSNWKEKTMTNADRIRAMSDEELAKLIVKHKPVYSWCKGVREIWMKPNVTKVQAWLEWLQRPAEGCR